LPKSTFNFHFQNLNKRKILRKTYEELLKEYFKKGPNRKLLYRYKDTTYIVNKNGHENVKYNGYKKRNGSKVSLETDSKGVIIHSTINDGNEHDAKIFINDTSKSYFIDKKLMERFSKYYSADPAYHTKNILNYLKCNNLIPIIKANIKNTKDKDKLKKLKLTKYETKIYNKRFTKGCFACYRRY